MKHFILFPKLFLLSVCLSATIFLAAQNNYAGYSAGFNFAFPKLQTGYSTSMWKGIYVRSKFIEFGYIAGKVTNPSDQVVIGYNAYLGGNFPFLKLGVGKRVYGIKGFLLVPYIAGGIGRMQIDNNKSFQFTAAPGLSLQLPYVIVDFRLNTSIAVKDVPGFTRNKLLVAPTIVLQFDALWDLMNPQLKFDGHYEGVNTSTSTWDVTTYEHSVTYDRTVTTTYSATTSTPYKYDAYAFDVGPHISVGPRVCNWNLKGKSTFMAGIVQAGRAHGFGYDLIAEKGQVTSEQGTNLKVTRAMGRLSFDIKMGREYNTHFTRFMLGAGIGYNWFEKSSDNLSYKNAQFVNFFASYELGAISFSYEINKAFYSVFDDQKYFAFTYRLPIERMHERYKQLKE